MSLLLPAEATTVERWTSRLDACENTKEEPLLALLVDKWGAYRGIAVTLCAPEPLQLLSSDPPLPFDLLTSFFCSHLWSYQVSPTIDVWSAWMWLVVQPCGCRRLRAALVPNGLSFCKKKTMWYIVTCFYVEKKNFLASEVTVAKKKKKKPPRTATVISSSFYFPVPLTPSVSLLLVDFRQLATLI